MNQPVTIRRRQEDRTALSDRRLVAAAVSLLIDRGIGGSTLAAIGDRAGYSRGLVTHRFGSKAGLFAHVHDTVAAHWIERVQMTVGQRVGAAALMRVVDALQGFILEEPYEIRAMYLLRYASIDPGSEFRGNVAKVHKAQRHDVERWIEAGKAAGGVTPSLDSQLAAELFCAAVDGVVYRWLVNPQIPIGALHGLLRTEVQRSLRSAQCNQPFKGKPK